MIVEVRKGRWALMSSGGKILGEHPSRKAAKTQEIAIGLAKARAAGHQVPVKEKRR